MCIFTSLLKAKQNGYKSTSQIFSPEYKRAQLDLALSSLSFLLQKLFLLQCLQEWFSLHAVGTNYSCGSMV